MRFLTTSLLGPISSLGGCASVPAAVPGSLSQEIHPRVNSLADAYLQQRNHSKKKARRKLQFAAKPSVSTSSSKEDSHSTTEKPRLQEPGRVAGQFAAMLALYLFRCRQSRLWCRHERRVFPRYRNLPTIAKPRLCYKAGLHWLPGGPGSVNAQVFTRENTTPFCGGCHFPRASIALAISCAC